MASDQELDLYMQAFEELSTQIRLIEEEHKKGERMPKSEFGPRMAQINIVQRQLIKHNKMMLEQLARMNNIFNLSAETTESAAPQKNAE